MNADDFSPQRIILVDSSGALHRCFHGYKQPRMSVVDGEHLNVAALYGYCEYVRKIAKELEYDCLVHVLDPEGGSQHRLSLYPEYKKNRAPTPPELTAQKKLLKPLLEAFGHMCIQMHGVESDDVLASLAEKYTAQGHEVLIITTDKDLMQLVKDGEVVLARYVDTGDGRPKTHEFYEEQDVLNKFGVRADQIADWLALVGDSVDNIPGVDSVGEKTATKLLMEHGSLSGLITNAATVGGKLGERLRQALPNLALYRQLSTVLRTIPLDLPTPPQWDEERHDWARAVINAPHFWPHDINGDLRDAPQQISPARPKI